MCGGTLEINNEESTAVCEYCGTMQTLPKLDNGRKENLYDRANHFRRNNDYDKAMGIYEQILNEDSTDAEAYWSLVLCRYGIEYVEDPQTHKRIPTCNRTQYTSIYADENYKSAIANADGTQKRIYESEAAQIDSIQKGILEISQKEEPFDVFICYKETDNQGRRTQDSVLAQDIYYQLKNEGYKVFFSKITLEDKLGTAYEPYIFAALNSAKIMIVVATKAEYVNAVWVKNEWSRYLQLVDRKNGKMLIPAYKEMDPYDLPEEFSHLQALDMSKLGFMQDLIRGVRKILKVEDAAHRKDTTVISGIPGNENALLKRIVLFLEDGEWEQAKEYAEKVLDMNPENGYAYFYEMMAECKIHSEDSIINHSEPIEQYRLYKKAVRFADNKLKNKLIAFNEQIIKRLAEEEQAKKEAEKELQYQNALSSMRMSSSEQEYRSAAEKFKRMSGYKDSNSKADECLQLAEKAQVESDYIKACALMAENDKSKIEQALRIFEKVSGYKDSGERLYECQKKIELLLQKEEEERLKAEAKKQKNELEAKQRAAKAKKISIIAAIVIPIFVVVLMFSKWLYSDVIEPNKIYKNAEALLENGDYEEAKALFEELGDYKDAADRIEEVDNKIYDYAVQLMNDEKYTEAIEIFESLGGFKDCSEKIKEIEELLLDEKWLEQYEKACVLFDEEKYEEALQIFDEIGDYKEAEQYAEQCEEKLSQQKLYEKAIVLYESKYYKSAYQYFVDLGGYKDSADYVKKCEGKENENTNDALAPVLQTEYGISLAELCDLLGNDNYEKGMISTRFDVDYREQYVTFNNYELNGIMGVLECEFRYDKDKKLENAGILMGISWECIDEYVSYDNYSYLKDYLTEFIGDEAVENKEEGAQMEIEYTECTSEWKSLELNYYKEFSENGIAYLHLNRKE